MSNAFKLKNGSIFLSTEAPGGIYNAIQLKKIATLCEGDIAIAKATEDQRLALFVKPDQMNAVVAELKATGLGVRHYQDGLHQPTSCIGEMCPDHEQDALGSAMEVTSALESVTLPSALKIGINGCAKCCVPCHTLDVSVVGEQSGYRISLGGKNQHLPEMASFIAEGVPASELPVLLKKVVEVYQSSASGDESLQSVIERVGSSDFIAALAPYSQDAAGSDAPFPDSMGTNESLPNDSLPEISFEPEEFPEIEVPTDDVKDEISSQSNASHDFAANDALDLELMDIDPSTGHQSGYLSGEVSISVNSKPLPDFSMDDNDVNETREEAMPLAVELANDSMRAVMESHVAMQEATLIEVLDDTPNEVDEDALEKEWAASIEAEEQFIDHSGSDEAREEALEEFSEADSSLDLEMSDDEGQEQKIDGNLSVANDDILILDEYDSEPTSVTPTFTEVQVADDEELDIYDYEPHLPLSEIVRASENSTIHLPVHTEANIHRVDFSRSWAFTGIDLDSAGNPVLSFANGVAVTIAPEAVSKGGITVGGQHILLKEVNGGFEMMVDGMKLYVPNAA